MELTKKIQSLSTEIIDGEDATMRIRLIDITTTNSLMAFGELRIANDDLSLNGSFSIDDPITVSLSLGDNPLTTVFTGVISNFIEGQLLLLEIRGNAFKMRNDRVTKSLNKVNAGKVIREIMSNTDVEYEVGTLPTANRHSYIMQGGTIAEELHRWNKSFELDFIPYFNRDGKLILNTFEEQLNETDVVFNDDEFKKFENGILETIVDTEIDVFDQIEIMDVQYYVASNRFLLNERKSKSFIGVTQI